MKTMVTDASVHARLPSFGWASARRVVLVLGVGVVGALLVAPRVGLLVLWNILIPATPALLVIAPGVWRNLCPLATISLWAEGAGISRGSGQIQHRGLYRLAGVAALLILVPLRRVVLDVSGPATAVALVALAAIALMTGVRHVRKSAWCSGLCPVLPVERLYGTRPLVTVTNARCPTCRHCSAPCLDIVPPADPLSGARGAESIAGAVLTGGFVGFVYGWFQVPDAEVLAFSALPAAYAPPLAGLACSLLAYLGLRLVVPRRHAPLLARGFGAAAVACYYWFRIPALFGYGLFAGDGLLVDLTADLPVWAPIASRVVTTALVASWLVAPAGRQRPWSVMAARAPGRTGLQRG